jgi:hypothetical protein
MGNARSVDAKEVSVLGEDDSCLGSGESEMAVVGSLEQFGIICGCHVDRGTPQPYGNCLVAVLIKMESNRPWHSVP